MTRQPPRQNHESVFVIKLRPTRPSADGIRGLRWILKTLLRRHGFRCTAAYEENNPSLPPNEES
jgi:hypothetical protein